MIRIVSMPGLLIGRFILDCAWLVLLIGLFMHFWRLRRPLAKARLWNKTHGLVTTCEWNQEGSILWPKIHYSYEVNQQDYVGNYLFLDTTHNLPYTKYARTIAYKVAKAYQNHEPIEVYFDPENPEQSALDVKIPSKLNLILTLLGILIVAHISFISFRFLDLALQ